MDYFNQYLLQNTRKLHATGQDKRDWTQVSPLNRKLRVTLSKMR